MKQEAQRRITTQWLEHIAKRLTQESEVESNAGYWAAPNRAQSQATEGPAIRPTVASTRMRCSIPEGQKHVVADY